MSTVSSNRVEFGLMRRAPALLAAIMVLCAFFLGCATEPNKSRPESLYAPDSQIGFKNLSVAVLPFERAIDLPDKALSNYYEVERQYITLLLIEKLRLSAYVNTAFYSTEPVISVDYVITGQIQKSGPDEMVLSVSVLDIDGNSALRKKYSIPTAALDSGFGYGSFLIPAVNDFTRYVEKLPPSVSSLRPMKRLAAYSGESYSHIQPQDGRISISEKIAVVERWKILQSLTNRFTEQMRTFGPAYLQTRSQVVSLSRDRDDAAASGRSNSTLGSLLLIATVIGGGTGAISKEAVNENIDKGLEAQARGRTDSEKAQALQRAVDQTLRDFNSFVGESVEAFQLEGASISGTVHEALSQIRQVAMARLRPQ